MILILSETHDTVTDTVCSWLNFYNKKFVRINQDQFNSIKRININNDSLDIIIKDDSNNSQYNLNEFKSLWNRRGYFNTPLAIKSLKLKKAIKDKIHGHLKEEINDLYFFIYECFKDKKCLNNPLFYNVNKLLILKKAKEVGLNIPKTLITGNNNDVLNFEKKEGSIITKNITNGINYLKSGISITQGTQVVNINDFENTETETFLYSIFQKKIQNADPKYHGIGKDTD